jgi:hypothetical protein
MQTLAKPVIQSKIALRTMTVKSILGFKPFEFETVQQIIDLRKINYLKLLYYKNSQVNFTDDILALIGAEKIQKPGINLELAKNITAEEFEKKLKNSTLFGQTKKTAFRTQRFREEKMVNKSRLRSMNQN